MSDVGLGANLELDITAALRRVDQLGSAITAAGSLEIQVDTSRVAPQITAAVDAADPSLLIQADTAGVTPEITSAVDAADSGILVTADAGDVTSSIDGAVDAADTGVDVTGDASHVTGAINGAVADAQSEAFVQVDGGVAPGLSADVANLGANLADASDEGRAFKAVLASLSVGAAATGLFQLADAASEAEQAVGGVRAVFGSASGTIDQFAASSAESAGIAATAARTLTSQIGGLLQGFDFTQSEAAATSVVIAKLGADLAATFGGHPEEAVQALGGALRGEFNPLERFGVSLNVAQINAYALEQGMAASTSEITLAVRAQAALALILERTSNAQGQFGREAETAAGAMSIAKAQAADLAATAGAHLTPAFLALVDVVSTQVLPALAEAGDEVLPAVSEAIVALAPLLGTTTQFLVAMAPVITLVANALAAIPPQAIALGAGLFTANRAISLLTGTFGPLITNLQTVYRITAAVAAARGVSLLSASLVGLRTALAGVSLAALAPVAALAALAGSVLYYNKVIGDAEDQGREFGASLRDSFDPATASLGELRAASQDLDDKIASLSADVDDSFLGRNGVNRDFNAALHEGIDQAREFQVEIDAAAAALERASAEAKFGPLIEQLTGTGEALDRLRDGAPAAESAIAALRVGGKATDADFLKLANTLDAASLSEEQMADAARLLGTDVETLQGFVTGVTGAVQGFVDTAVGALPSLSDAFGAVGEDSKLSVQEFRAALDTQTGELAAFRLRLQQLADEGFVELAATIAQQGPAVGGALAAELSTAIGAGNLEIVQGVQDSVTAFNTEWTNTSAYLRDVLGPEFVLTTGLIGSAATTTFGENLDFGERLRIAGAVAALEMDAAGQAVAAIAATEGEHAAREYGNALELDQEVIDAAVAAGAAIKANAPTASARSAGSSTGGAFGDGIISGMSDRQSRINDKAQQLVLQARAAASRAAQEGSPSKLFESLGRNMGLGVVGGLDQVGAQVVAAAERIVRDAASGVAAVAPEVSRAAAMSGTGGGSDSGDRGLEVVFGPGSVVVHAAPGMTPEDARELGGALIDGAEERIAERRLSIQSRTL